MDCLLPFVSLLSPPDDRMTTEHKPPSENKAAETASAVLNRMELSSIYALLAYVAYTQNVSEDLVKEVVQTEFGVSDIGCMESHAYDDAIRFLVDLQIEMLLN